MSERGRVGLTVTNAQTGEPLEVDADITRQSIVLTVGDDAIYAVHRNPLTKDEARVLLDQLVRATGSDG